jgi:hypothetical protein
MKNKVGVAKKIFIWFFLMIFLGGSLAVFLV